MNDDLKTLWQKQETEYAPMPLEEIRKQAGKFHSKIHWRNVREYIAAAIVAGTFSYCIFVIPSLLVRAGCELLIRGAMYVVWRRAWLDCPD